MSPLKSLGFHLFISKVSPGFDILGVGETEASRMSPQSSCRALGHVFQPWPTVW